MLFHFECVLRLFVVYYCFHLKIKIIYISKFYLRGKKNITISIDFFLAALNMHCDIIANAVEDGGKLERKKNQQFSVDIHSLFVFRGKKRRKKKQTPI